MSSAFKAGLVYTGVVFAFAFVTGILRTILLAQDFGLTPVMAVLIELPLILIVAWIACRAVLRHMQVAARMDRRAIMGVVALATTLALEFALATMMNSSTLLQFMAGYGKPEVMLGLMGQIAFAAFPLLRMRS
jgi:multisubunit Na+/H+ antiporter MnhE subunit